MKNITCLRSQFYTLYIIYLIYYTMYTALYLVEKYQITLREALSFQYLLLSTSLIYDISTIYRMIFFFLHYYLYYFLHNICLKTNEISIWVLDKYYCFLINNAFNNWSFLSNQIYIHITYAAITDINSNNRFLDQSEVQVFVIRGTVFKS